MARRVAGRGFHKTIDYKEWSEVPALITAVSAAGTVAGASLGFARPATILRVRGFVQAQFDTTLQLADRMLLTFGLGVVSTDAFAVGAMALPDPGAEPEYPWLWWGQIFLLATQANVPGQSWGPDAMRLEVDSKAMRRIKPGQSLVWAVEISIVVGAPVVDILFGQTRVLIGT